MRANAFRVGEPVFSKLEGFFPIQEIETVVAGFFDQLCKLSRGNSPGQALGYVQWYDKQCCRMDLKTDAV